MKKALFQCSLFVMILLLLSACKEEHTQPQHAAPAPEVSVVTLAPTKVVLTTELIGRTTSFLKAEVRPQVSGIIRDRLFDEGGQVKKDEVLYQIEPDTYQATYDSAKAALAKSEASLWNLKKTAERQGRLIKTNSVSQSDYDVAQANYLEAKAAVEASKAALQSAEIDLRRTKIRAPISGRISKSSVTVGALVTADQTMALATIYDLEHIYVDVTQSAEAIRRLRKLSNGKLPVRFDQRQAQVTLILSDGTQYPYKGTLEFADVGVDETTGTVTIRAKFPNPTHELLPGLYVRAILTQGEKDDALLVPQRSLLRDNRGDAYVYTVTPENKIQRRSLTVGNAYKENWLVLDGLKPGDKVVVEGLQKIRNGIPVRSIPYVPKAKATDSKAAGAAPAQADAEQAAGKEE